MFQLNETPTQHHLTNWAGNSWSAIIPSRHSCTISPCIMTKLLANIRPLVFTEPLHPWHLSEGPLCGRCRGQTAALISPPSGPHKDKLLLTLCVSSLSARNTVKKRH